MTTDLSLLSAATEQWDTAAKDFESVQKVYESQVKAVASDGTWTGVANSFARPNMEQTHGQYTAAAKEARAVASLLRDAQGQLSELRAKLHATVADAEKAGMRVSEGGVATLDHDKPGMADAARRDPTGVREAEASWNHSIGAMVQAVDDFDQGVRLALRTAVRNTDVLKGGVQGFNAGAEGAVAKAEAQEVLRLAAKLRSSGQLDTRELADMQRLFRDNEHNEAFSQTLLDGIGPDGTIGLANQLNDLVAKSDPEHKPGYSAMQIGLATSLAVAMENPDSQFYSRWREGLRKAGAKNFGSTTDPLYGYQSLVGLMEHHDKYGQRFLNDLGGEIIDVEKQHPDIWTQWRPRSGVTSDPLDHLLGLMGENPDAATSFLDPGADGKNDHLRYLLKEREWPKVALISVTGLSTRDNPVGMAGLGAAIEAAATGHGPLNGNDIPDYKATHSVQQARVMHDTVKFLDPGASNPAPAELRQPVSNALAEYTTDTHEILSGNNPDYKERDGVRAQGDRINMSVDHGALLRTMRGLSEDPTAYATLHRAESFHISDTLDRIPDNPAHYDLTNPMEKAGAALGAYSAIREDVINDKRAEEYSGADWKSKVAYHILGGVVTPLALGENGLPIGDALQRGVDTWAWEWSNEMKAAADAKANAKISEHYLDAEKQMALMTDGWRHGRGISTDSDQGRNFVQGITAQVMSGFDRANNMSKKFLK
ncbi:DUF6571 family protein [Streptomyces gamaensis]|uniref:DUF6571 family protein n=1 Tax=Streptomyces gamaensis TaxID=1763542 RepID=A0ABW0Z889_9ACTN